MNNTPRRTLVMLEDDHDRLARFTSVLQNLPQLMAFHYRRTAPDFIAAYKSLTCPPSFIALDHDLFVDHPDDPDPGDGRDVASFLAEQTPCCPILIHSTNAFAADSMLFTLRDAGWTVDRIAPLGDDWIESYWFPYAMKMLGRLDVTEQEA